MRLTTSEECGYSLHAASQVAIFSGIGYVLLLLSFVIYFKLKAIRFELIGVPYPQPSVASANPQLFHKVMQTRTLCFDEPTAPPFTLVELKLSDFPRTTWWRRLYKVTSIPNKQQALFW